MVVNSDNLAFHWKTFIYIFSDKLSRKSLILNIYKLCIYNIYGIITSNNNALTR